LLLGDEMSSDKGRGKQTPDDCVAAMPAALFRAHAPAVFAVCLANTHNHHDAEDVMQAVFLKAIAKISSLREPARARAWLLQTARRECVDFHRRRKLLEPLLEEPSAPAPGANAVCEVLHDAIGRLPQDYREALVLYYLEGRNCSSVAASLGIGELAVRQRLVRARAALHRLLDGERP
jgi:RNA polymerase sigma-70 factor (ECF subfamily)